MLNRSKISQMQQKVFYQSSNQDTTKENLEKRYKTINFEEALELCQKYITKAATHAYRRENNPTRKREITKSYINEFVDTQKPIVQKPNNKEQYTLIELKEALTDEITHYGPVTKAMEDDTIDEIRANGPDQIFIEKSGKTLPLGNKFYDREHMERIISKLIGVSKVRLTPKIPMVNARTVEGYRVNATHADISPYDTPAFVIRKFSKKSITPDMMIKNESFSINMFKLLSLIPKSDSSWITVGPTGSGKTTLNEILVKQIDPLSRIITIENPSEMRLIQRENDKEHGKVINDVLQYESVPDDDDSSPATMENLLINAMRQSPHWIGPGELRTPGEFATALRAAQTGHYFFTTLHAEGDEEAIYRFLTAYLMASNEPAELALRNICSAVKFVIYQEKLADGTRKVTSISEITGSKGLNPIINPIYKFVCEDVQENQNSGIKIMGYHKRVGTLSENIQQSMLKSGIKKSKFEFLTKEPSESEKEVYFYDEYGIDH
ncbi:pilus assembly protein CpaF [Natranaerovirga hydrolytica]|uniref:Pilus assembly protein CpaF n=1 Tax=Natranaerovirga hydrolytica TaxID=680378 RepID=A0A4R1MFW5_9FIRM|nr:ATPase, T2SS/T4P/T4SS family [Natranaerovirga hydrolytica]TCK90642.1 pilus assembly protein CpaF [Natranaerovirga hydrolytica]